MLLHLNLQNIETGLFIFSVARQQEKKDYMDLISDLICCKQVESETPKGMFIKKVMELCKEKHPSIPINERQIFNKLSTLKNMSDVPTKKLICVRIR